MKTMFQGIKDLLKLSWQTWLITSLIGPALSFALLIWFDSIELFGFLLLLFLLIGPLLPFIRSRELIKSKNISNVSMIIAHVIGVLTTLGIFSIYVLIYLLLGGSQ